MKKLTLKAVIQKEKCKTERFSALAKALEKAFSGKKKQEDVQKKEVDKILNGMLKGADDMVDEVFSPKDEALAHRKRTDSDVYRQKKKRSS